MRLPAFVAREASKLNTHLAHNASAADNASRRMSMLLSLAEAAVSDEQSTKPENEGTPAKPDGGELASSSPVIPPQSAQPSLEEWIARYGHARIPWAEWDRAVEAWKAERRADFERKKLLGRIQSAALQQTLS
jgi:hypothetical protein